MSKNYVCCAPYLRNCILYDCHLCCKCVKWYFQVFFSMLKFWFSRLSAGWKGNKWPKMLKISVCRTLYFRNRISYDLHLWYTCMYKRITSLGIFFIFFKILIFRIIRRGKRAKNGPKLTKFFVCLTPHLRNHTSYDCDFWCTCAKWWFYFAKFWFWGF